MILRSCVYLFLCTPKSLSIFFISVENKYPYPKTTARKMQYAALSARLPSRLYTGPIDRRPFFTEQWSTQRRCQTRWEVIETEDEVVSDSGYAADSDSIFSQSESEDEPVSDSGYEADSDTDCESDSKGDPTYTPQGWLWAIMDEIKMRYLLWKAYWIRTFRGLRYDWENY